MVAGAFPRSWNIAASQFWLTTLFPWKTTRPLNFRLGSASGKSGFFSTTNPKSIPMWTSWELRRASAATSAHSRTEDSSHACLALSLFHSLFIASLALGFPWTSFLFIGLVVKAPGIQGILHFTRCRSRAGIVGSTGTPPSAYLTSNVPTSGEQHAFKEAQKSSTL